MPGNLRRRCIGRGGQSGSLVKDADAQNNLLGHVSTEPSSAPMLCISRSDFC